MDPVTPATPASPSQPTPPNQPAQPSAAPSGAGRPPVRPDVRSAEVLDGKYHRLGKKTLLVFVLERIPPSIILFLITVAAFAFGSDPTVIKFIGPKLAPYVGMLEWWLLVLFLVVFGLTYFISWLIYYNYKFMIGEDSLKISRGILDKEEIAIPYRQIQDVDIDRTLYFRLMGLSELVILTAGHDDPRTEGSESEGILPAMDRDLAEWMRDILLKRTEIQRVVEVGPTADRP